MQFLFIVFFFAGVVLAALSVTAALMRNVAERQRAKNAQNLKAGR